MLEQIGSLPLDLEILVKEYSSQPVTIGMSGASVYLLQAPGKPNLYLKTAPEGSAMTFKSEVERLRWMKDRLPVPEALYYAQTEAGEYLLLTEISGKMAFDSTFEDEIPRLVKSLAAGLKMLHSLDTAACPFDMRLDTQIEAAHRNTEMHLVDGTDFDAERLGRSAADVFEELLKMRPASEDLVFTHGDHCLPNVIINPSTLEISGFVDLGRAGIADRYQDLALAVRSLIRNWGEKYVPLLFKEYGIKQAEIDWGKIEFYKLLDEFF
ncbi:MAG: aminoglycoside 3'-phosphotransferase [Chloroflexi bacterium]|nr:aminoglycoside 3'-phosphotransferase [Chloroflexota bacterium]OJV94721.1 MAG: hypothetical protein BGO39_22155 [Chloroflexi bacterium 54-19]